MIFNIFSRPKNYLSASSLLLKLSRDEVKDFERFYANGFLKANRRILSKIESPDDIFLDYVIKHGIEDNGPLIRYNTKRLLRESG